MGKVLSILGIVVRVLAMIVLLFASLFSLATAYIMFAPDSFPKPFYIQYTYPTPPVLPAVVTVAPEETPEPEKELVPGEGLMVDTGTKIINLADPAGKKYIRVTVVLEFAPPEADYTELPEEEQTAFITEFNADITARMPVIDDVIITLLSIKTFDELYTAQGKEALRVEIMERIAERLPEHELLSVYFTEFIVD